MSALPNEYNKYQPMLSDVKAAHRRIKPFIHRTPIFTSKYLAKQAGLETVVLKCENFQKTGSFKARGATNAVIMTQEKRKAEEEKTGVKSSEPTVFIAASSGNHAQAVSYAARCHGGVAQVVVPATAPAAKVRAMKEYGGNVTFYKPITLPERYKVLGNMLQKYPKYGQLIHSSDDHRVIAGQGTLAVELLEQVKEQLPHINHLDAVVVPVGGGGMLSGVALAIKSLNPKIKVVAAEPERANDTYRSFKGRKLVDKHLKQPKTIADGLLTVNSPLTFKIMMENVDDVVTVTEEEIANAIVDVYERCKLVIEPSAGTGVAVALKKPPALEGCRHVGIVICGGNLEILKLPQILAGAHSSKL